MFKFLLALSLLCGIIFLSLSECCTKELKLSNIEMIKQLNTTCKGEIEILDWDGRNLTTFDYVEQLHILPNVTSLLLRRNKIQHLKKEAAISTKVSILDLSKNQIKMVDKGSFDNFNFLQTLLLHDNQISDLPLDVFQVTKHLQKIVLSNNKLTILKWIWFSRLESLETLLLSNNTIRSLQPIATLLPRSLCELNISNNSISLITPTLQCGNEIGKLYARQYLIFCESQIEQINLKGSKTCCKTCLVCKGDPNEVKSHHKCEIDQNNFKSLRFCESMKLQLTYNITDDVLHINCLSTGFPPSEVMTLKVGEHEWVRNGSEIDGTFPKFMHDSTQVDKIYCSAWNLIGNISEHKDIVGNTRKPEQVSFRRTLVTMTVILVMIPLAFCSILIYGIVLVKFDIYPDKCQTCKP